MRGSAVVDYEEQARALFARSRAENAEAAIPLIANTLRTAAEDATRRERELCVRYVRGLSSTPRPPIDEKISIRLWNLAEEIEKADHRIGYPDPATPPPPRPATGEALAVEVENCNGCPFSFRTGLRWHCTHEAHGDEARKLKLTDEEIERGARPDWCPLVETPVLVRINPTPPARTEHASEHATSQAASKPARTEDGGRCDLYGEDARRLVEDLKRGCSDEEFARRVKAARRELARVTAPPEPEAARCASEYDPTGRAFKMRCQMRPGHDGPHIFQGIAWPDHESAPWVHPDHRRQADHGVNVLAAAAADDAVEGWRRAEKAEEKLAALVEAARAVLPMTVYVGAGPWLRCEGCSSSWLSGDDPGSAKHEAGCKVAALRAALAGVES